MIPAQLQQAFNLGEKVNEGRALAQDFKATGLSAAELFALFYGLLAHLCPQEADNLIAGVETLIASDAALSD